MSSSSNNNRAKILLVGPVHGQLRLLSEKLNSLQKSKAGPFDVCLCAGPFFSTSTTTITNGEEEATQIVNGEVQELISGSLAFNVPVVFVDVGNSAGAYPEGLQQFAQLKEEVLKKDEDEIDLDDVDDVDEAQEMKASPVVPAAAVAPDGLIRIANNLYQLVGDGGTADIVSIPLPLQMQDNTDTNNSSGGKSTTKCQLTVGFLYPHIRLPCKSYEAKAKHTSFLGCDVLLSSEWGQGMFTSSSSSNIGRGGTSGALTSEDRNAIIQCGASEQGGDNVDIVGSYDVAELVAMARPRYHVALGPLIPISGGGDDDDATGVKRRRRFIASLPYRYPASSSSSGTNPLHHAGRFLAMGSVVSPAETKALGKAYKFIHAVGIVPLPYMDASDREAARESNSVVDCPYTDASYAMDENPLKTNGLSSSSAMGLGMNYNKNHHGLGLSEAQARRLAQEDAAAMLGGGAGGGGAFRWQQRQPTRKRPRDGEDGPGDGDDAEEAKRQALEAENPNNCSLFLHGLHRDPGMTLTMDALMNAFRPFGCVGVRFPKPKMNNYSMQQQHKPSYAFLDFNTHEEALQCLADLKGEAVVNNITLNLKWSSSSNQRRPMMPQQQAHPPPPYGMGFIPPPPPPPPPPQRRNRLTEAEAADSTTLFLRLPSTIPSSAYPAELETMRLLAQGTMEEELNVGVSLDSPDRITAKDEPALRVNVRHPNTETNYAFLEFCSHAAALTVLVALTKHEDGGVVGEEKLAVSCLISDDMLKKDLSHLRGVTLYWAKGGGGGHQPNSSDGNAANNSHGLKFNKRHFPIDSRTDCWFCLASPTCEKHLIVAVYDECYVALPKGGVNEYHALIIPVEHGGDGALVNRKLAPEMDKVKSKLRLHARTELKKDLFVFERCIQTKGGYHTHVQCIPVDADSGPAIQAKMLELALRNGFKLKEITSDLGLNALEDDWSDGYFYAEIPLPGGGDECRRFIYRAGDGSNENGASSHGGRGTVPLQFGREVLAEVMQNPDIGQWKACVVSQEKEQEWTTNFRKSFQSIA
ncbi:hypothetical protein ACHAWU_004260 [Discostella pseudostelligera]|uniref:RRM domain-containing protein n=1 Tax=Discostella pseudostelligera TaxID=259834 RepID=A0ABD3MCN7_9STRA